MTKYVYSNSFKTLAQATEWKNKKHNEGYKRVNIEYRPGATIEGNDYIVMIDLHSNRGRKKSFGIFGA